ncbi:MAG: CvpA family protein [Bacteroidota bacterium]
MSTIDIIILIPLLWGAYRGFQKGLILELLMIAALILGIVLGFKLIYFGMDLLNDHFEMNGQLLPYISFIIIFLLAVFLVSMVGKWFKKLIDYTLIGSIDNFLGALLGLLKWALGLSTILWLSASFDMHLPEKWTDGALIFPYLLNVAPKTAEYVSFLLPFTDGLFDEIAKLLEPIEV